MFTLEDFYINSKTLGIVRIDMSITELEQVGSRWRCIHTISINGEPTISDDCEFQESMYCLIMALKYLRLDLEKLLIEHESPLFLSLIHI